MIGSKATLISKPFELLARKCGKVTLIVVYLKNVNFALGIEKNRL